VRKDLGLLWEWLPEGALDHDPNAYSKSERSGAVDRPQQTPIHVTLAQLSHCTKIQDSATGAHLLAFESRTAGPHCT